VLLNKTAGYSGDAQYNRKLLCLLALRLLIGDTKAAYRDTLYFYKHTSNAKRFPSTETLKKGCHPSIKNQQFYPHTKINSNCLLNILVILQKTLNHQHDPGSNCEYIESNYYCSIAKGDTAFAGV